MLNVFIKFGDGRVSRDAEPANLTAALRDPGAVFWLDITQPTDEEYALLDDVFGFHPLAIEDTMQYSQRPKIESYNHIGDVFRHGYFFMVIHGPDLEQFRQKKVQTSELDLFVSQNYLITVHDEPMKALSDLMVRAGADCRIILDSGIDMLLHNILDHLIDNYLPILDDFQEVLDSIEERAVTEPTTGLLSEIAERKKELLNLRRIIGPQRDVLAQLTRGEIPFIRETTRIYLRDVLDHLNRAVETIEIYRDLVMSCRDIYMSSINNHLNQIMKTLTIISVIALPLTVITSFFGMNFVETVPGFASRSMFGVGLLLMVGIPVTLLYMFKKRHWM
jgi:magnesium transporter